MDAPLYGPAMPPAMQSAFSNDPRLLYARRLMQEGSSTAPVKSWVEGLARALQAGVGGYFGAKAQDDWRGQAQGYQDTMRQAAEAMGGDSPDPRKVGAILAGNPWTADKGTEYTMNAAQRAQDRQENQRIRQEDWDRQREARMADFEQQRRIAAQYRPAPSPIQVDPEKDLIDPRTGKVIRPGVRTQPQGFAGTGMDAQAWNVLMQGEAANPQLYAAAWAHLSQPKTQQVADPNTGQLSLATITPSLPFPAPGQRQAQPAAGAAGAAPPDPQAVPTTPAPAAAQAPAGPQPGVPTVTPIPGTGTNPKLTESQEKAQGFADRMMLAEETLTKLDGQGTSLMGRTLEAVPGGVGNYGQSEDYQVFDRARRGFINAFLRRDSGATIIDSEFRNAEKEFFPQPGDQPAVIEAKRQARQTAIASMMRGVGPGYKPLPKPASQQGASPQSPAARPGELGRTTVRSTDWPMGPPSDEDIAATARKYGKTVEQVKKDLGL